MFFNGGLKKASDTYLYNPPPMFNYFNKETVSLKQEISKASVNLFPQVDHLVKVEKQDE